MRSMCRSKGSTSANGAPVSRTRKQSSSPSGLAAPEVSPRGCVAAELLAERHRCGVHQMGPPGLDHGGELLRLTAETCLQMLQRRDEVVDDGVCRGNVNARRKHVIARL